MTGSDNGRVSLGTSPANGVSNLEEAARENEAGATAAQETSLSEAPRRSGRRVVKTTLFDPDAHSTPVSKLPKDATGGANGARRNPKRKASEPAKQLSLASSDLLEEALRPLEPAEIEEWEGWIELESEPVS